MLCFVYNMKQEATRSIESSPENNWNTETLQGQGEIYRKVSFFDKDALLKIPPHNKIYVNNRHELL